MGPSPLKGTARKSDVEELAKGGLTGNLARNGTGTVQVRPEPHSLNRAQDDCFLAGDGRDVGCDEGKRRALRVVLSMGANKDQFAAAQTS